MDLFSPTYSISEWTYYLYDNSYDVQNYAYLLTGILVILETY